MTAVAEMADRLLRSVYFSRHVVVKDGSPTGLFYAPIHGSQELIDYKGRLYRRHQVKVGVIGSSGRAGQTVQAAGSIALPGNISPVRSPVRSGIARALTPGGGSGRGRVSGKPERGFRCPEGFQFGGRYTDENFTTCGKQLFDIPSLRETIGQAVFRTRSTRKEPSRVEGQAADVRVAGGESEAERNLNSQMVTRAAAVPKVGDAENKKREAGIKDAIEGVQNQDSTSGVLVRRDGYSMIPVVSAEELRKVPDNRNMEEAAFVLSARSADQLGSDELGFLSNTGVTTLVYVLPNGVQFRLDRKRELSTGERRQLGKDVNAAQKLDTDNDPLAKLNYIIENTDGAFELSEDYGDVKDADETVTSGKGKGMPRWAAGAFADAPEERVEQAAELDESEATPTPSGPGTEGETPAEAEEMAAAVAPPTEERITSLENAIEHLNEGGLLSAIDPVIAQEALEKSKAYKARKLRDDVTLYETENGQRLLVKERNVDFEALGAHLSSEVLREMGVQAPAVRLLGEGDDKPFAYRSPDGVIENTEIDRNLTSADLPPERLVGIQVADWLTDTRDRSPASVIGVRSTENEDEVDVVAAVGPRSALIGLSAEELEERRNVGIETFFDETTKSYGQTFESAAEEQKAIILQVLDGLIARAKEFNWDEYREKLQVDGNISEAELAHLEIVQGIFTQRLEALENQRDLVATIMGLQS